MSHGSDQIAPLGSFQIRRPKSSTSKSCPKGVTCRKSSFFFLEMGSSTEKSRETLGFDMGISIEHIEI